MAKIKYREAIEKGKRYSERDWLPGPLDSKIPEKNGDFFHRALKTKSVKNIEQAEKVLKLAGIARNELKKAQSIADPQERKIYRDQIPSYFLREIEAMKQRRAKQLVRSINVREESYLKRELYNDPEIVRGESFRLDTEKIKAGMMSDIEISAAIGKAKRTGEYDEISMLAIASLGKDQAQKVSTLMREVPPWLANENAQKELTELSVLSSSRKGFMVYQTKDNDGYKMQDTRQFLNAPPENKEDESRERNIEEALEKMLAQD